MEISLGKEKWRGLADPQAMPGNLRIMDLAGFST